MVVTKFKYLNQYKGPYQEFMRLYGPLREDETPEEQNLDAWTFYSRLGGGLPPHIMVGEHNVEGPREPAIVWTGTKWICSEDDLTEEERSLMDQVAARCPGGLAGWS